jgi:hypothetical protein
MAQRFRLNPAASAFAYHGALRCSHNQIVEGKRHVPHGACHFCRRQPVRLLGGLRCGAFTVRVGLAGNALDLAYGNPIKLEAPVSSEHQMMPEIPMPQLPASRAKVNARRQT